MEQLSERSVSWILKWSQAPQCWTDVSCEPICWALFGIFMLISLSSLLPPPYPFPSFSPRNRTPIPSWCQSVMRWVGGVLRPEQRLRAGGGKHWEMGELPSREEPTDSDVKKGRVEDQGERGRGDNVHPGRLGWHVRAYFTNVLSSSVIRCVRSSY